MGPNQQHWEHSVRPKGGELSLETQYRATAVDGKSHFPLARTFHKV